MDDPSPLFFRRAIQILLIPTILLPVGMVFLFTFGRFFAMSGDRISAAVLDWTALGLGFFWFLGLVALLLAVVLLTLGRQRDDTELDN